jgi:cytochrome c-type biogenesis protein CcmH/NrfG
MSISRRAGNEPGISTHQRFTAFTLILLALLLSTLTAACSRGGHLPDKSSQEYRDAVRAFYVGLAALQVGEETHAEEGLTRVTQLAPGEPAAWANLGLLSIKQREFDVAAQRLEKARELEPKNSRIILAQATLASSRGDLAGATSLLRRAIELDPRNLKAIYSLAQEVERQGGDTGEAEAQQLMGKILEIQPDNLAVLLEVTRLAAKRGDTAALQDALTRVAALATTWPQEAKEQLTALQTAAAGADTRAAGARVAFLRNVLVRIPEYRADIAAVKLPTGELGEPFTSFLKLPSPSPVPAPQDDGLTFTEEPLPELATGKWAWAGAVSLDGESAPSIIAANGREVRAGGATLNFPGGPQATPPTPDGVLALDFNYDFKMDLALSGAGGFKLYRQEANGSFTDVTAKLPASITGGAYRGAWAADIEMDGDLDIVLGATNGPAVVLRNNGDGTFKELRPFEGATDARGFVWADLDADGDPDAVLLSADGKPHEFTNERGGTFHVRDVGNPGFAIAAITVADLDHDAVFDLIAVGANGSFAGLFETGKGPNWQPEEFAKLPTGPSFSVNDFSGRLIVADVDNNGGSDFIWATQSGTNVWLSDSNGKCQQVSSLEAQVLSVADLTGKGRLDLIGVAKSKDSVRFVNRGTKDYHWQSVRPRAATATGDQRINTFGIGGEMEIRAGLLFQKQPITAPVVHFGLGENTETDVLRISWPNGFLQAEFDLKSEQSIVADQRLKGSCPSLFAYDGKGMRFVKDCAPWSPAIGLRINAVQTVAISQTEEWQKIRGDQLVERDGYYDLRITAELWETFYIDHYELMSVDHPEGTDIFVDERTSNPAPKLGLYKVATPRPVKAAWDDNHQDVTDIIRTQDGRYLDTFGRGQYQGVTRDHYVEIELGETAPTSGPLYLLAHGWMHPTDASINIALSQGSHPPPQSVSIEVPDASGKWVVARPTVGFPAGKNKTMVFDLDGIFRPGAPRRLRLRTSMEIYWDQLEWAAGRPDAEVKTVRSNPQMAELRYRGFSVFNQADKSSPETPDYDRVATTSQRWRDLVGYYTRYGDIRELLEKVDDRIVIVNAGDEMAFRFPAQPPPPAGFVRDYVFIGEGWIKDGDFNSVFSKTVLPLPTHNRTEYTSLPARLEDDQAYRRHPGDWQEYHTRYVTPDRFQKTLTLRKQAWE